LLAIIDPPVAPGVESDKKRKLGLGRHPIAAGDAGFGVAIVDETTLPPEILLRTFDPKGTPLPGVITVGSGLKQGTDADPVVAALPGGKYAVAWTDFAGADGSQTGIAFRIVDPAAPSSGLSGHVNVT